MKVYLVGSLKDPDFPNVAKALREAGFDVFDDWRGGGHDGDHRWRMYEMHERGRNYVEALEAPFAVNNFDFDKKHLDWCEVAVAVCKPNHLPGRSATSELTYVRWGRGKQTYILLNGEPEEWDLMLPLTAHAFFYKVEDLIAKLKEDKPCRTGISAPPTPSTPTASKLPSKEFVGLPPSSPKEASLHIRR